MSKPTLAKTLPAFVEPMLAKPEPGEPPADDDRFLFEIKWDGFRAMAFVDGEGRYRLLGRRKTDFTKQFPELAPLGDLPPGCVIDGEIVAMSAGRPVFAALLTRQRRGDRGGGRRAAAPRAPRAPVTFVAFDLLYEDFRPIIDLPCEDRRARLEPLLARAPSPRIVMSRGVSGGGEAFFEQVRGMGLEGVVAKRRNSRYEPGRRSGAWLKYKARQTLTCAIVGYEPSEERGLKSLIIAAPVEGELRCVGQVGSGITAAMHRRLLSLLADRPCKAPPVPCTIKGRWVVPDLFCTVSYAEWTGTGKLRAPVFERLHGYGKNGERDGDDDHDDDERG